MNKFVALPIAILLFLCTSCDQHLSKSLELAGDNRAEMEKVLEHFKDDPDRLKYRAAQFLIENMPYHHYYDGVAIEQYDSLYGIVAEEAVYNRNGIFEQKTKEINFAEKSRLRLDIESIKADYLIKAINQACDQWSRAAWKDEYDESVFFDYVLPYRLANEQLSDWWGEIKNQYPMLTEDVVYSRRGIQMEAEDAVCEGCENHTLEGASNGVATMLTASKSSVTFLMNTEKESRHCIIMKYATASKGAEVSIDINGKTVETVSLCKSRNMGTLVEKWTNTAFVLKGGSNAITIRTNADTLILDYVQLVSVEPFAPDNITDLAAHYYTISNASTCSNICFDTKRTKAPLQSPITLRHAKDGDNSQIVRLDYQGYPLWSIHSITQDTVDVCMEVKFGCSSSLVPDSFITHAVFENKAFQQWVFFPLADGSYRIMNKFNGMFLESFINKTTGVEHLVQKPFSYRKSQRWVLTAKGRRSDKDSFFHIGSAFSEAMRVYDVTHQFQYFMHNGNVSPKGSTLFKTKTGKCVDETNFSVYLCRYLGIPSASDFTPNWGNRSQGHSWSVLIKPDGKSVPFYMNNMPGDTIHFFHTYKKPKVFRHRFRVNRAMLDELRHEKEVPDLFKEADFVDVSEEYFQTVDVTRSVPKETQGKHIAYICVFDNRNWVPVFYGKIKGGNVTFRSMGKGIAYIAAFYENGTIKPFGSPFVVEEDGTVRDIVLDSKKLQTMKLVRKYPFLGKHDLFNSRMDGGQFQGANDSEFKHVKTLYTHKGITNGNWYEVPVRDATPYRYLRYMGAKGSYCNINELELYDKEGNRLQGKIIGTEGEPWGTKEKVFDGDILTGFGANSPDGNWVGLELDAPRQIGKIRFIGRNDGNTIEVGDRYVLSCWQNNEWKVLSSQTAKRNSLMFKNMPSGGLYILRDITKGHEERIFTYDKGEQIWW